MKRTQNLRFLFLCTALIIAGAALSYPRLRGLSYRLHRYRAAGVLLARLSGYQSASCDFAEIYYTAADEEFVSLLQRSISLYYPLMTRDFQLRRPPKLKVVLHPEEQAMPQDAGDTGERSPMGVYYGGVIHILSPRVWAAAANDAGRLDLFLEQGPLIHEIAHYLTDVKTDGNFEVWFTEGVALYYEYKYTAFEWRKDLKEEAAGLSPQELNSHFDRLNQGLAYRKAFDLVNGLVERQGEDALQALLAGSLARKFLL